MSAQFQVLQRNLEAGSTSAATPVQLVSVTIDPEFDQPAVLRAYGSRYGANAKVWRFATGSKEEIGKLEKAFAVYAERNGATLDHTLTTALIDPDLKVQTIWRGNQWKPEEVLQLLPNRPASRASLSP